MREKNLQLKKRNNLRISPKTALISDSGHIRTRFISSFFCFILLAAFVTVAVEAVSMGAGEFLSDTAVHELDKTQRKDNALISASVMLP